jgi:hypothetical protein
VPDQDEFLGDSDTQGSGDSSTIRDMRAKLQQQSEALKAANEKAKAAEEANAAYREMARADALEKSGLTSGQMKFFPKDQDPTSEAIADFKASLGLNAQPTSDQSGSQDVPPVEPGASRGTGQFAPTSVGQPIVGRRMTKQEWYALYSKNPSEAAQKLNEGQVDLSGTYIEDPDTAWEASKKYFD